MNPRRKRAQLAVEANFFLWIPEGVTKLRGIIVHQHGCGDGAEKGGVTASHDLHWQALAAKVGLRVDGVFVPGEG